MTLALLSGLGVTALLFAGASRLENDKVALAIEQRAHARLFLLQQGVANTVGSLASVNHLFASRAAVSRAEFHLFTKPLLQRYPYVQAISYLRVVPHEGRAAYEQALAQLRPGAVMTEMRDGKPVPAGVRDHYRVVDYIEPQDANEAALGLDTAYPVQEDPARQAAYATGEPMAGPLVPLAQQSQPGVIISMPVYRFGAPLDSEAARLAALQGETAAVLLPSAMVARILSADGNQVADGLAMRVYAAPAPDAASLVYQSVPAASPVRTTLPSWLAWLYPQHAQPFASRFDVAGKTWLMTASAPPAVYAGDHLASLFTLAFGALVTALGAAWVHALASRSHEVRRLVEERTAELRHQATHDALTGLPNRALLADRLLQTMHHSERKGHVLWLVSLDLDRFKFTNSRLGHKGGDRLLQAVAERLQLAVRPVDTVARMGGDEFALMLLPEQGALSPRADQFQRVLDCLSVPLHIDGQELFLTCSTGIAVYPDDGTAPGVLMERADIAMFRAKEMGGDNVQFYTAAMNDRLGERMLIEGALRSALERNEFVLHYQPQTDIVAGRIVGMEALIRWQHPELGMVAPNRFIPLAEETGQILPVGAWVLRTACEQLVAWRRAGHHGLRMAVNVSARQMAEKDFVQSVAQVLADTGLPPSCLELELTESQVMNDIEHAIAVMHELKKLGVLLAIDDFGTGYSSLAHLKRFEIDVLKIDQTFVRDLTVDPDDAAIVTTIIALANNLGLDVISEGVETVEQLEFLRQHGCRQMQGYYFSRPAPAAVIEATLRDDAERAAAA
ncbi:putative bifunctional diguanylate cyclase/phosphodiesterase [Pseudoduganella rivuli]|uniref:putative bifunctional diguanylate cyclase/phosphodiesterase n=1 Tax=Pseudoduganella rivuli TaxID=2666085 RepID=UPI0035306F48